MATTAEVVNAFLAALSRRDFAAARRCLADDFQFRGPFDAFDAPEPYLAAVEKLYTVVQATRVRRLFVDGDEACLLYDMETATPAGTAFICEWFRVRGSTVSSMQAVFDARPFAPMFGR